ncbi:MAG TPA: prolipoprotein diacylglyceryl transferase family protein [Hanamia sp.]
MNFPFTIQIGDTKILWHIVLETIGFIAGYRYFVYLRKKQSDSIESENRTWILIGATFGALLGSRLIGGLENPPDMLASKNILAHFYENKTIVGGLLGGLFGVELVKKAIGEKQKSGDLFTYPIILGMMIGRIGCFSMGVYEETYGTATSLPWGMNLGDGVLRHPVALYEILFLGCTWIFLIMIEKKFGFAPGAKFKLFMILYLFYRLMQDFIKPHYTFPFGLSTIQLTCIAGLIYYSPYIFNPKKLLLTKPKYT